MCVSNKDEFIRQAEECVSQMYDQIEDLPKLELASLDAADTALIVIDLVNGFTLEGALSSPRVKALIAPIADLATKCRSRGIPIVVFADSHPEISPEFTSFPVHCLENSSESEVVDELKAVAGYHLIPKNSTNGFLEPAFCSWLLSHPNVRQFVIVGDCTDICILQFAMSIKAYFNMKNQISRIGVIASHVDTFDAPGHAADVWNVLALNTMMLNGVEVFSGIEESEEAHA